MGRCRLWVTWLPAWCQGSPAVTSQACSICMAAILRIIKDTASLRHRMIVLSSVISVLSRSTGITILKDISAFICPSNHFPAIIAKRAFHARMLSRYAFYPRLFLVNNIHTNIFHSDISLSKDAGRIRIRALIPVPRTTIVWPKSSPIVIKRVPFRTASKRAVTPLCKLSPLFSLFLILCKIPLFFV